MGDKQAIFWVAVAWLLLSYFTVLWQFSDIAHLGVSLLFGLAIWDLQTRRKNKQQLPLKFRQPQALIGGVIVILVGLLNFKFQNFFFMRSTPFLGGFGVVLMAFSWDGLKTYRRELGLLFFLGLPSVISHFLPDPSPLAAWFGSGVLNLVGVNAVFEDGTNLVLPSGTVQVFRGCSGLEYMNYLLGISILCLTLFPISSNKRYWIPVVGVLLGFIVNGFRVALLAVLAAQDSMVSFDYWHEGQGSLLFGGVAILIFGGFYSLVLKTNCPKPLHTKAIDRQPDFF